METYIGLQEYGLPKLYIYGFSLQELPIRPSPTLTRVKAIYYSDSLSFSRKMPLIPLLLAYQKRSKNKIQPTNSHFLGRTTKGRLRFDQKIGT